jgi:hypothetical protein
VRSTRFGDFGRSSHPPRWQTFEWLAGSSGIPPQTGEKAGRSGLTDIRAGPRPTDRYVDEMTKRPHANRIRIFGQPSLKTGGRVSRGTVHRNGRLGQSAESTPQPPAGEIAFAAAGSGYIGIAH